MQKSADAFRTISEVADDLDLPQHVLRFWETRFAQIRPLKRAGGRRYYRPADVVLLRTIRQLLYDQGYTIKGVQRLLKERGIRGVRAGDAMRPDMSTLPSQDPENFSDLAEDEREDIHEAEMDEEDELPASVLAVLEGLPPVSDATRWPAEDRDALRDALSVVEECQRILASLQRSRA